MSSPPRGAKALGVAQPDVQGGEPEREEDAFWNVTRRVFYARVVTSLHSAGSRRDIIIRHSCGAFGGRHSRSQQP